MSIIADTHLHFYPFYDPDIGIQTLLTNLGRLGGGASRVGLLAERADCCFFEDLRDGRIELPGDTFHVVAGAEPGVLEVREAGETCVSLFAGQQIATDERIEILALALDEAIPDGLLARRAVERVLAADGIPVLAWAPGKWFAGRGQVVRDLIEGFQPGQLLIGDTTMRPTIWPEPGLMRLAADRGLGILAGSDPLPFPGEECRMGTYASLLDGDLDPAQPVQSIRQALRACPPAAPRRGRRGGAFSVFLRFLRNATA